MKPQTEASAPVSLAPDKPRYEWIDNARLIAALLIIYAHMWLFFPDEPQVTSQLATNLAHGAVLFGRVPYFLILAGYFLGRKITWHKALDRAFWLFVPFVIWNVLAYLLFNENASIQNILHEIPCILGLGSAFRFMGLHPGLPAIGVTWFLRDIIVLSLLSPLLVRFKWFLLAVVAVVVAYPGFDFKSDGVFMLAPHTCFFYILGTCLCGFRIDDAYCIFNKKFTPICIVVFLAAVARCVLHAEQGKGCEEVTLMGPLLGAMLIAHSGVLIEKHLPKFSKMLAPCGPACFLVFVLHYPILTTVAPMLPSWITNTWLVWLVPIPTCAFIIAIFLLMKRYTPWLMPYLGHMKVPKKQG